MRIALGQINPTVGDLEGNVAQMAHACREAARGGADLVVFPELSLNGYPPRDLVEKPSFLTRTAEALERLAAETAGLPLALITGYAGRSKKSGKSSVNAAAVLEGGRILFRQVKMLLPSYDVFDEERYFQSADHQKLWTWRGRKIALTICEDAWNDRMFWERRLYKRDPVDELARDGARMLISINASPYHMGKRAQRREIFANTARRHQIPVIYVNQVGGNDQLVFDGSSFALDARGEPLALAASLAGDLVIFDIDAPPAPAAIRPTLANECEAVYEALVLGTRDYIRKCGFRGVIIGLSGGIDSSLTAAIAVDAVGRRT